MVGYLKSQRHAASDRRVSDRLAQHALWMDHYQKYFKLSRGDASARAMTHVRAGERFPVADQHPPWKGE